MKVYITYDRYERNEWFNVYHISTDIDEAIKHCKEVDLVDFISYGPDDCHSFQLQEVEMTKKQYEQLLKWDNDPEMNLEDGPYYDFMCEVYDKCNWSDTDNVLISTDGCSDFYEIVKYYGVFYKDKDIEDFDVDSDDFDDYQTELYNNEELFIKVLQEYINDTY